MIGMISAKTWLTSVPGVYRGYTRGRRPGASSLKRMTRHLANSRMLPATQHQKEPSCVIPSFLPCWLWRRFPRSVPMPMPVTRIAHTHQNDANVTVLSGTFHIAAGDNFDEVKGETIRAGGYAYVAGGMKHYAFFPEEMMLDSNGAEYSGTG